MRTAIAAFLILIPALLVPRANSQQNGEVYLAISKTALKALPRPADAGDIYITGPLAGATGSAADLVDSALPVLLRRANGAGGLATAGLRGFQAKQTAVFYDGLRVPADLTGTVDLSALPAGGLERVEILPGAWSSVQGADAEGGIMNFISRKPAAGVTRADLSSGLASYGGNSTALAFMNGRRFAKTSFTASRDASDGFQQNSAWRKESFGGRAEMPLGGGAFSVSLLRNNSRNGVPGGTPAAIEDWNGSRERTANSLTDLQRSSLGLGQAAFEVPLGGGAGLSLSGGSGVNRLFSHTSWGDELSRVLTHNARLAVSFAGRGEAGVEYDKSLLKSDTYGDHFRQNAGLFAQWALEPAKGLTFIPSLRYDRNVAYAHQASPRLAVVYAPDYVWKFSAQTGRAWQAPTFADLYNPWVPAADRSPDLRPEHSWQTQAAAAGNFACGVWARLAAYYADVRDRIALDPAKSWAAYNLDSAFNRGVEAGLGYKSSAFSAGLGYAYNISKGRGAAGGYKPLAFSPKHRFTLDAMLKTAWFDVGTKAYYSARQYTAADSGGLKLPSYFTADLYLSRKLDRFEVFAGAENLLDEHYAQTADTINGYYPLPGRVLKCGLSVRFI